MRSSNQSGSGTTPRQKIIAVVLILIVLVIGWQVIGMFHSGSSASDEAIKPTATSQKAMTSKPETSQQAMPKEATPGKTTANADVPDEVVQQQTAQQKQYVDAINQLQMLKISRQIAETTQAIMTARLAAVTAQKNIVGLLSMPNIPPGGYAKGLVNPALANNTSAPAAPVQVTYTVISVSKLQNRWNAVIGYQGNLFHVQVGDVLPSDQSVVQEIDGNGVVLEKDGVTKKLSLVPII